VLFDVVRMRRARVKLNLQEVRDAAPTRARLHVASRPWREKWRPDAPHILTAFAYLFDHLDDDPIAQPIMELRGAHVNRLDAHQLVIVGIERSGQDLRPKDEAQAWWCRLVRPLDQRVSES
jgi:hypothetical protein